MRYGSDAVAGAGPANAGELASSPPAGDPSHENVAAGDENAAAGDPWGVDEAARRKALPLVRALYDHWWRVELRGLEHVPTEGAALLIGNHSGALPLDALMLATAVAGANGEGRVLRPLYHRFMESHAPLAALLRALGGVPASFEAGRGLLARGELVALFPEGVAGTAKLFSERYRLQPFATSSARLSCMLRVPIVPFTVVGAEESYPMLGRSTTLGRRIGVPYVPITPAFPALGPLGALPLPTRWRIRFGPRIRLWRERRFRDRPDDFAAMTERLRRTVGLQLRHELARRTSVF